MGILDSIKKFFSGDQADEMQEQEKMKDVPIVEKKMQEIPNLNDNSAMSSGTMPAAAEEKIDEKNPDKVKKEIQAEIDSQEEKKESV